MKVLVAEDNRDSRELVSDILLGLGYTPLLAADGRDALRKIQAEQPDLVILDVNMPGMDGFAVCEAVKRSPATAHIPVIMLTAQADLESRVTGLRLGADDYLTKPFYPRELIARIEARLRSKEQTDALRAQRQAIRETFERFVAHEIVEQLLEDPGRVHLGGVEAVVTVLFADLEGFTAIAEQAPASRLIEVLNQYHALLVHYVKANRGTLNKFLGDGIMALYNTPLPLPDHALAAVRTALDIRAALVEFHAALEPLFRLDVNVGIHTGPAIVGTIGTPEQMDFTAIGDTVNLASRLEDLSDHGEITVSEETYRLVEAAVIAEPGGPRALRGREGPVLTWRILGLR